MHKQKCFWVQAWHVSNIAKVRSAWLPPRHRSMTTPFKAREIWKLLYQANLHGICTRAITTMDRMLVSNYFEAIGKSFLWKFHLRVECDSIELNDPTLKIQPAPNLSLQPDFKAASLKTKIVTSPKTKLLALIWS